MRLPDSHVLMRYQLLLFVAALLVMAPGGAVQMDQDSKQQWPADVRPAALSAGPDKGAAPVKRKAHRCAPWASCNGQITEQRVEKQKAMLLAMMMGLSLRS